jgi:hypothetical protein
MPKLVIIFIMSLSLLLPACTGLSDRDLRLVDSIVSVSNQVSIKRQRYVVISPASVVALQVIQSSSVDDFSANFLSSRQLILRSLRQHFQRVELVEIDDFVSNDFDFIVKVKLLNIVTRSHQSTVFTERVDKIKLLDTAAVNKQSRVNDSAKNLASDMPSQTQQVSVSGPPPEKVADGRQLNVIDANEAMLEPVAKLSIGPLQALIKLSLIDARNSQLIDVAVIDAYSSSVRKPSYDNFLTDIINQYANKITTM